MPPLAFLSTLTLHATARGGLACALAAGLWFELPCEPVRRASKSAAVEPFFADSLICSQAVTLPRSPRLAVTPCVQSYLDTTLPQVGSIGASILSDVLRSPTLLVRRRFRAASLCRTRKCADAGLRNPPDYRIGPRRVNTAITSEHVGRGTALCVHALLHG